MSKHIHTVGVDEVGRGALIGDVVAAAVILPIEYDAQQIIDSKRLSESKRLLSSAYIKTIAIDYAIGLASATEIDVLNIHHATLLAMQRAVAQIQVTVDRVWIDGKYAPELDYPSETFIKGDNLHDCIAAASILAKTYRDAQLQSMSELHPQYGFSEHKGYPTKKHRQAIEQYGILPQHRRSYKTIKALL